MTRHKAIQGSLLIVIIVGLIGIATMIPNILQGDAEQIVSSSATAVAVILAGVFSWCHQRGWKRSGEAAVIMVTTLAIAATDPVFLRAHQTYLIFIPPIVAAALLSWRWTFFAYSAMLAGMIGLLTLYNGALDFSLFGPTFLPLTLAFGTGIASGIASISAVAGAQATELEILNKDLEQRLDEMRVELAERNLQLIEGRYRELHDRADLPKSPEDGALTQDHALTRDGHQQE